MKSIILEGKSVQISDESFEALKKSLIKEERWVPEIGDMYYFLNVNGTAVVIDCNNDKGDLFRLGQNNVFKTGEEAKAHSEKLHAISKITNYCWENGLAKEWVKGEENYSIYLVKGDFETDYDYDYKNLLVLPYLKSEEACEEVIEKFEDELKLIF